MTVAYESEEAREKRERHEAAIAQYERETEAAARAAVLRESDDANRGAPSPDKVRFDNPRFRSNGSKRDGKMRWRGTRLFQRPKKSRRGIYLGTYRDRRNRIWHLRADGVQPRGVIVIGPPGIGKSASFFIPTLLTTTDVDENGRGTSVFAYDPKGELFMTTAGIRRAMGQKVLLFAPTQAPEKSCHINPFDSIRWGTIHEVGDVQNIVKLILDPKDKAAEGAEAHWIVTGSILLECVIIWLHYNEPENCNLRGCYDYLTDPRWLDLANAEDEAQKNKQDGAEDASNGAQKTTAVDEALKHMLKVPHHPSGKQSEALKNGWVDAHDKPSAFHPYVVHSAIEIQGKAPNEKSGVVSTTTRFLHPFRDGILAELTSYSDVSFDDLMNYVSPVSMYFWIPPSDVQRLRVIVSLFLQLLVRAHTGDNALEYRDGVPYYRYRHRLLLAVDEYAQMGKQEQFILALSVMRSYGLWPMLGVQSPSQVFDVLGPNQSLTPMMFYKVFLKPNDMKDAEWISEQIGYTTKREEKVSYSGGRFGLLMQKSVSIDYSRAKLMEADTVFSMPQSAAIVIAGSIDPNQWDNPIWAGRLFWEDNPEMRRRSGNKDKGGMYPAPERSDIINPRPPRSQSAGVKDLLNATDEKLRKSGVVSNDPPAQATDASTKEAVAVGVQPSAAAVGQSAAPVAPKTEPVVPAATNGNDGAAAPSANDVMQRLLAAANAPDATVQDEESNEDGVMILEESDAGTSSVGDTATAANHKTDERDVGGVATPQRRAEFLALAERASGDASPSDELEGEALEPDDVDDDDANEIEEYEPDDYPEDEALYQPEEDDEEFS